MSVFQKKCNKCILIKSHDRFWSSPDLQVYLKNVKFDLYIVLYEDNVKQFESIV